MKPLQHTTRRSQVRLANVTGDFPGQLICPTDKKKLNIRVKDVSETGIGAYSGEHLEPGSYFWLIVSEQILKLEVVYCNLDLDTPPYFFCGFVLRESELSLAELFSRNGCLSSKMRE